jgi:hypothetical protein
MQADGRTELNIKMKYNMYTVRHNYLFILLFQMLATSFGLNRPSPKNTGAYNVTRFVNTGLMVAYSGRH